MKPWMQPVAYLVVALLFVGTMAILMAGEYHRMTGEWF